MVEVGHLGSLPSRLESVDSGVSDMDEVDGLSPSSWSSSTEDSGGYVDHPTRSRGGQASQETRAVAVRLAHDVVRHMTEADTRTGPGDRHAKTVRRMVDELSSKHEVLFRSLVRKLDLTDRDLDCQFLGNVADKLFLDKQCNWGRIVTLYAFAGTLARHCVESHLNEEWPGRIADRMGNYIAENMSQWIASQGGWDAMDEFFKEQENIESKIWRGLLYTVIGLGALATTVAVVR